MQGLWCQWKKTLKLRGQFSIKLFLTPVCNKIHQIFPFHFLHLFTKAPGGTGEGGIFNLSQL